MATDVISEYLRPENGAAVFDPALYPDHPDFRLIEAYMEQGENRGGPFVTSAPFEVSLQYEVKRAVKGLRVGIDVLTVDGITLWRSFDDDMDPREDNLRTPGIYKAICRLPDHLFFPRQYVISLSIGIHMVGWISFGTLQQTVEFYNLNGVDSSYADEHNRAGLLMLGLDWRTTLVDEPTYCTQA